jgi:hypothetical protein
MDDTGPRLAAGLAVALALLSIPAAAVAGEVRWYVPDAADRSLWSEAAELVWRGEPLTVELWAPGWPPQLEAGAAGEQGDPADRWHCWLQGDGETPASIVVAPEGLSDQLHVPLAADGLSREEVARAALLLTLSMRRTIQIADAGWMPAADLADLLGADLHPADEEGRGEPEPGITEPPVAPVDVDPDSPEVDATSGSARVAPQFGVGVGIAARPGAVTPSLAPAVQLALVRGPWIGPGLGASIEVPGERVDDPYRITLFRAIVTGRWQLTPTAGRWSFPLALGLGVDITRARLVEPEGGSAGTGVAPLALLTAGVQLGLGERVSLALILEASADLVPVRVAVEGPDGRGEVDLNIFTLSPRLGLVLHPPAR